MSAKGLHWVTHFGDLELTTLADGAFEMALSAFAGAPPEQIAALDIGGGQFRTTVLAWLVRRGDRLLLVDAGGGATMGEGMGGLPEAMAAAGVEADAVTDVILTHMHLDHFGGMAQAGRSAFANARIHIAEQEWSFWTAPERLAATTSGPRAMAAKVQDIARVIAPQVERHSGPADLGDGVALLPTPGHTPGHQIVDLQSGGARHLLLGDLILSGELQFEFPDAFFVLDGDIDASIDARRRIFDWLADDEISFSATHLAFPGAGVVRRVGGAFVFESLAEARVAA